MDGADAAQVAQGTSVEPSMHPPPPATEIAAGASAAPGGQADEIRSGSTRFRSARGQPGGGATRSQRGAENGPEPAAMVLRVEVEMAAVVLEGGARRGHAGPLV